MGDDVSEQLQRIAAVINPRDICPVIPTQSVNPRRADNIMIGNGPTLFGALRADPSNLLYASEANPFQLYRGLSDSMENYREALRILTGMKLFVSPLSSKSLSVGAMLACFEQQKKSSAERCAIGLAYIESLRYEAARLATGVIGTPVPYSLWITGDCYG
jgi:hypothetical protein